MGLKNVLLSLVEGKPLVGKNQVISPYWEEEYSC